MTMIFVFGSNEAGVHGAGAARTALVQYGAEWGVGRGRTGDSYAIPTKDREIQSLSLDRVSVYVDEFLRYANDHPELNFYVTRVGCGLAGFTEEDMIPLFAGAPFNCAFSWDAVRGKDPHQVVPATRPLMPMNEDESR